MQSSKRTRRQKRSGSRPNSWSCTESTGPNSKVNPRSGRCSDPARAPSDRAQVIPQTGKERKMRVMVFVPGDKDSEAGKMPSQELIAKMLKFNEELVKAGVMLAADGLTPTSKAKRVKFSGSKRTVIDGPFTESKE